MTRSRILIVDDMPANIRILGESLRAEHDIAVATSGPKALEIARGQPPDLILLDIMMPGMDGYAVCRQLKADSATRDVPVIFITALGEVEDELKGLELGAVDYIAKPFHIPVIKARVRTHLDLKRKYDLLASLVSIDGLTEIPNRRRLDESLEAEWRRCQRAGAPLSAIMVDIDFFKQYNDHYGHTAGDDCLRHVARALKSAVQRPADLVARYGGEEFAALLPETDAAGAGAIAERMRLEVEALHLPHDHSAAAPYVTVSLGVATAIPGPDASPLSLIEAADAMLYQAKSQGRNRVARTLPPQAA